MSRSAFLAGLVLGSILTFFGVGFTQILWPETYTSHAVSRYCVLMDEDTGRQRCVDGPTLDALVRAQP